MPDPCLQIAVIGRAHDAWPVDRLPTMENRKTA